MKEKIKEIINKNFEALDDDLKSKIATVFENTLKNEEQRIFTEATKKAYGNIDDAITNIGFEKPTNIKTSEFVISKIQDLKNELQKLKTIKPENTKEKSEKDNLIKELQKELNKTKKERGEIESNLKNKYSQEIKKMKLLQAFPNFQTDLPTETIDILKERALSDLSKMAELAEDGKVKFIGQNGIELTNPNNLNNPFTTEELLKSLPYMKAVFETSQKTPNIGTDGNSGNINPSEYMQQMIKQGMTRQEAFEKTKEILEKK